MLVIVYVCIHTNMYQKIIITIAFFLNFGLLKNKINRFFKIKTYCEYNMYMS
jgi:hypothetical protein